MPLFVFGHRNPDTDAICSAIAYADFLRRTTRPDAIAACCGPPNQRTEYALKVAKLSAPRIVMDVHPLIEDVCQHDVTLATRDEVFYDVYRRMDQRGLRSIPVHATRCFMTSIVGWTNAVCAASRSSIRPVSCPESFRCWIFWNWSSTAVSTR